MWLNVNSSMYVTYFVYSSVDEHVGCFQLLVIVNDDAVNIGIQVSIKVFLIVAFICISLIIEDVELLYMSLFATHISSLVKCSNLSSIFKNCVVCFFINVLWEFLMHSKCKFFLIYILQMFSSRCSFLFS